MILFVQSNTATYARGGSIEKGVILADATLSADWGVIYCGGVKTVGPTSMNVVNMETGEILRVASFTNLPEWVKDPLIRAIKLAEFLEQEKKNKTKGQK